MLKNLLFVFFSVTLFAKEAFSVVVIGAGPVGLLTALEAHKAGMNVILVEDRNKYTRTQSLFLFEKALDLLEHWNIDIPSMKMCELINHRRVGLLEIKELECSLLEKVSHLNIQRIKGRFIEAHGSTVEIATESKVLKIAFDILVGADGFHSAVRKEMLVPVVKYESAVVSSSFIEITSLSNVIEIPKAELYNGLYVKKLVTPLGSYIMIQKSLSNMTCHIDITDPLVIEEIARAFGWIKEAELIAEGHVVITGETPVYIQRSLLFSDPFKRFILVGDAAAVSSFIQGMGVNYGFQTAVRARDFMIRYLEDESFAFESFSEEMDLLTDEFIEDSKYLIFSQPPCDKVVEVEFLI
jgi:2-polyprenyl-6-methoxyphenol hydroxylase-like FAD-dependent oxidoreductase